MSFFHTFYFTEYHMLSLHIFLIGGIYLNNNFDMEKMMSILSKMDKKELEAGIAKANQMLQTKSKDEILKEINKNK